MQLFTLRFDAGCGLEEAEPGLEAAETRRGLEAAGLEFEAGQSRLQQTSPE